MSDVDAKPFAIDSIPLSPTPSLRGATRRSNPALFWFDGLLRGVYHRARIRATRWLAMTSLSMFIRLLLLLLLLVGVHHPPLRQHDRLAQHIEIADVIGKDQNQRRIEIGALRVGQSAMRLDDSAKGVIRFGEIRAGRQYHRDLSCSLRPAPARRRALRGSGAGNARRHSRRAATDRPCRVRHRSGRKLVPVSY